MRAAAAAAAAAAAVEISTSSHKAHTTALISVSLALSQTPVYTARPQTRG